MFILKQSQLVTEKELEIILTAWNVEATLPTKRNNQIVCFPGGVEYVELSPWVKQKESDYKGRLYRMEFYSRLGTE